ncbi:uncharacterized protein LOC131166446 [Malania oleifera]|uniref:uncharacterized protein LOC131166446 n=1 Tax=Malania oleifera TaxID=397392 RepID=UPI0025AE47F4|nr:uncharacterized protein LOC131166446 [Malania oleifera]
MDTLSSSVSTFGVPAALQYPTSRPLQYYHHFKSTNPSHHLPPPPHLSSTTKHNPIPNTPTPIFFPSKKLTSTPYSFLSSATSQSPPVHRRAAAGYAAALLDVARSDNSIEAVGRDIKRLRKLLRNGQLGAVMIDPFMSAREKKRIVQEVVAKGKFHKYVVGLMTMLVERNKLEIVGEMLEEFRRIYNELRGITPVVLVSTKIEEENMLGIAKRMQKLSGTMKMKVRQHSIDESLPSLAA